MPTEVESVAQEKSSLGAPINSQHELTFLCAYLTFLFSAQAAYAYLYVHSIFLQTTFVVPIAIRLSAWTAPVLVYLIVAKQSLINFLKLGNARRGVVWGVGVGFSIVLLNLVGGYVLRGHVGVNFRLPANYWFGAVVTVGLSEEVVFRGFLLSAFSCRKRFWVANLLQAAVFLAIHLTGWALMHQFIWPNIVQQIAYVFLLGVMLGFVRYKSDSLWACMLIHSFSNFAALAVK